MKGSRHAGAASSTLREVVRVMNVGLDGAACVTSYGSTVTIRWVSGIPDPLPAVGELWHVEVYGVNGTWRFVSRVPTGSIGHTSYWVDVDWRTCVGCERSVVDDVVSAGFDGIVLSVGADGQLAWDCDVSYGLKAYGDNVLQVVRRATEAGLRVRLSIDSRLWSDVGNDEHALYTQRTAAVSDGEVSYSRSSMMSPTAASAAVAHMADDLRERYGAFSEGLVIYGFGLDGSGSDFSPSAYSAFVANGNVLDVPALVSPSSAEEWSARDTYDAYQRQAQADFVSAIRDGVGSWVVSAVIPSERFSPGSSEEMGARATGVWDDFGSAGWTSVGMPLDYQMSADAESAMRSLEVECAELLRIAGDCPPMARISVWRMMPDPMPVLSMCAKYGIPDVVVDDYEMWRSLSDDEVEAMRSAMAANRVSEVPESQSVGFVVSQSSINASGDKSGAMEAIEGMCSDVVDRVPHRLSCLFDSDLASGAFDGLSAILVACCEVMDEVAVDSLLNAIGEGYRGFVLVGEVGSVDGSTGERRDVLPLSGVLGSVLYGEDVYMGVLDVDGTYVERSTYSMPPSVSGSLAVTESGDAESVYVGGEGMSNAPVSLSERSAQVGFDVTASGHLWPLVGELVARAVGRDS